MASRNKDEIYGFFLDTSVLAYFSELKVSQDFFEPMVQLIQKDERKGTLAKLVIGNDAKSAHSEHFHGTENRNLAETSCR
jgi:hypothetical protein